MNLLQAISPIQAKGTIFALSNSSLMNKIIHKHLNTYSYLFSPQIQHISFSMNTSSQSGYNKQQSFSSCNVH